MFPFEGADPNEKPVLFVAAGAGAVEPNEKEFEGAAVAAEPKENPPPAEEGVALEAAGAEPKENPLPVAEVGAAPKRGVEVGGGGFEEAAPNENDPVELAE